jgi:hypothetical protein
VAQKAREHLGQGKLKIDPSKSVFINCPFDQDFAPLFDAIIFATVCCGFFPRSALESGSVAEPRMERITRATFSSKYSIHDLSRCKGEGDEHLARFNMALELGIAIGRRCTQRKKAERHDWLLLVPEDHDYARFVSDLAGFDPCRYDGTVNALIPKVMSWLAVAARNTNGLGPQSKERTYINCNYLLRCDAGCCQFLGQAPMMGGKGPIVAASGLNKFRVQFKCCHTTQVFVYETKLHYRGGSYEKESTEGIGHQDPWPRSEKREWHKDSAE